MMYGGIPTRKSQMTDDAFNTRSALVIPNGIAYLATPYSRMPDIDRAFQQASRIAAHLSLSGITLFCPIAHSHPMVRAAGLDHRNPAVFAALNKFMLDKCASLIVVHMDGWRESDGMREEIEFFERTHKPIFDMEDPASFTMKQRRAPTMNDCQGERTS